MPTEVPSLAALTSESKPDESQKVRLTSDPVLLSELPPLDDPTSESKPDNSQTVRITSDPVSPSEVTSSYDVITAKNDGPTVQILFIDIEVNDQVSIPLISSQQEESPLEAYPAVYPVPPPSNLVVSFNWDHLVNPRLPASIPFRIIVQVYRMVMAGTIIDEGSPVSILSSTAWEALGSPLLLPEMRSLVGFHREITRPLGILPNVPITLEGKTIQIGLMVVQGPLDYNLLLGRDYIYRIRAIVSSLFRVMCFPHEGRTIKVVDQLSFPGSHFTYSHLPFLNGLISTGNASTPAPSF